MYDGDIMNKWIYFPIKLDYKLSLSTPSGHFTIQLLRGLKTLLASYWYTVVIQGLPQYVPGGQMLPVSPSVGLALSAPPTQ